MSLKNNYQFMQSLSATRGGSTFHSVGCFIFLNMLVRRLVLEDAVCGGQAPLH